MVPAPTLTQELLHRGSPGQVLRQFKAEGALELRENASGDGYVFEISNMRAALYQDGKIGAGAFDAEVLIDVDSAGRQRGEPLVVDTSGTGTTDEIVFPFNDEPAFVSGAVQIGTLVFDTHAPLLYTDTIPGGFRTHKNGVVSGKILYNGADAILIDVTGSLHGPNVNMSILGFAVADAQSGLIMFREAKAEGEVVHPQFGRVPLELRSQDTFTW